MNKCDNYDIPCPYALSELAKEGASLSCFGSQDNCNEWREKYQGSINSFPSDKTIKLEEESLRGKKEF